MSTLLKTFIVLTLVMTVAFLFVQMTVFATRENWKRRWNEETKNFTAEVKVLGQQAANESANRVKAENQLANREAVIVDLQAKIREESDKVTERENRINGLNLQLSKNQTDYNSLKDDYTSQGSSLEKVRARNAELASIAQIAKGLVFNLNVKLSEVEDDLNKLTDEHTRLAESLAKTEAEKRKADAFVALVRERHPKVYAELKDEKGSTKAVRAIVAAVKELGGDQDLVMISVGKDEQVEEGLQLMVFRGDQYIVKVRVEKIMNDMAACRVLHNTWNTAQPKLKIQQGDSVQNL